MKKYVEDGKVEEKVVVLDMCVKDPKTGEIVCVKDGFEMIVRKRYPKGFERDKK